MNAQLILGVIELVKAIWPKKSKINRAVDALVAAGLKIEAFKSARRKIDDWADAYRAKPADAAALVLEADEVLALDLAMDGIANALGKAGDAIGL